MPGEDLQTVYYSKIYEFHLDREGELTTHINNYHCSMYISEHGVQGTFEIRGKDTVHILNTPFQEIREYILAVWTEVRVVQAAAQNSGS